MSRRAGGLMLGRGLADRLSLGLAAAAFALGVPATAVLAQQGQVEVVELESVEEDEGPASFIFGYGPISRQSLGRYFDILELTPDQREVVMMLHEPYIRDAQDKMRKVNDFARRAEEMFENTDIDYTDAEAMQKYQEESERMMVEGQTLYQNYIKDMKRLYEGFVTDVQAVLDEAQTARWGQVERMRRREVAMKRAPGVSWVGIDLVDLSLDLGHEVKPGTELAEVLGRYETELDRVVEPLLVMVMEMQTMAAEMEREQMEDPATQDAMEEKWMGFQEKLGKGVRDVRRLNREYTRRVESTLPAENAEAYKIETRKRAFGEIYKPSRTAKALEAAAAFDDLEETQRETIASLTEQYERAIVGPNQKWADAKEKYEDGLDAETIMEWEWMEDESIEQARWAREEVDEEYLDRLRSALTEGQRERLPEEEDDGMWGW